MDYGTALEGYTTSTRSGEPNVLGTTTDVSLYFTPASVTGTAAYIVPSPTLTSAPSVQDGQIKPTAIANYTPSGRVATTTTSANPDTTNTADTTATTTAHFSNDATTAEVEVLVAAVFVVNALIGVLAFL